MTIQSRKRLFEDIKGVNHKFSATLEKVKNRDRRIRERYMRRLLCNGANPRDTQRRPTSSLTTLHQQKHCQPELQGMENGRRNKLTKLLSYKHVPFVKKGKMTVRWSYKPRELSWEPRKVNLRP